MAGVGNTVFFAVYDPKAFGGVEHFLQETDSLTKFVRDCPPSDPTQPITLPGDPERNSRKLRLQTGITIPDGTWAILAKTASELNVALPQ